MMKNSKDLLGSVVKTAQMGKTGLECVLQAPLRPSLRENLEQQAAGYEQIAQEALSLAAGRNWQVEQLHGLPSALQIHHSQAGVEEAESLPLEDAPLVRSTPRHCLQHRLQDLPVFPGGAQNACNCAHNHHSPFQARYSLFRVPGSVNGGIYQGYLFFHGAA